MEVTYLIDGYNVLYHARALKPWADRTAESARDALIDAMACFCTASGQEVAILFDGRGHRPEPVDPFHSAPGLQVIYSPGHQTADTLIERMVYDARDRRAIIVVTGDRGIRDLCRGLGARVMDAAAFLQLVDEAIAGVRSSLERVNPPAGPPRVEDRLDDDARARLEALKKRLKP